MRIACFHNRYRERGGEDVAVETQIQLLAKAGHDVRLCAVDNREEIRGVGGALRTARFARWNPHTRARVAAFLEDFPADVAHVHNFFPVLSPSLHHALHERGVPVVQTLHNFRLVCGNALLLRDGKPCEECVTRGPWRAVRHACYRGSRVQSAVWADMTRHHRRRDTWRDCVARFVVPSAFARDLLAAAGLPVERTCVIPNPVEDPNAAQRRGAGAIYVGRLSPEKGVDLLLDAWRALDGHPLTLVGAGPEEASLRRRAEGLPNVHFAGSLSHPRALEAVATAAFAVVPSRAREVFGLTTLEAMARARPVIVPAGSAMAELVEPGSTGLHFSAGDAKSLAAACRRLACDPDRTQELGLLAREAYEARFAPDHVVAGLEAVYASVAR